MDALDGNAIAGDLFAAFGHEMTDRRRHVHELWRPLGDRRAERLHQRARHRRPLPWLRERRDGARAWHRPLVRLRARRPRNGGLTDVSSGQDELGLGNG